MTRENREAVLNATAASGIIDGLCCQPGGTYFSFQISPRAVQAARAIQWQEQQKDRESRDIVAELKNAAKSNPIAAWVIIGFIVLTALITFVNQLWQLIDRVVKSPHN
jgi:hypothetical protein